MSRIALYREWRPRTFDQVVEQQHTVAALRQSVRSGNISHAYLFSGTRGTGKTTLALILSRAINCLDPRDGNPCNECEVCRGILDGSLLDVVEVDAASNNSVDNIRRICDEVVFAPSLARYKVYIIDEVHMLSTGAFNALLKTLEEPPAHAVFILATTDPHRIPATILSRCQRYEFHRIPFESMVRRLRDIATADDIRVTTEGLEAVAALSDGALRDAISLLDQCRATFTEEIGRDQVLSLAGLVNDEFMHDMVLTLAAGDAGRLMEQVDRMVLDGRDILRFTSDLAAYYRNVMVCRVSRDPGQLVRTTAEGLAGMRDIARRYDTEALLAIIRELSAMLSDLRWAPDPRTLFEISLIRLMQQIPPVEGGAPDTPPEPPASPAKNEARKAPVEEPVPDPVPDSLDPDTPEDPSLSAYEEPEPEPEPEPESFVDVSPETDPEPPVVPRRDDPEPEPGPTVTPEASVDTAGLTEIWQRTQDILYRDGQMLLFLHLRQAHVTFQDGEIQLRFGAEESHARAEVTRKENDAVIRAALAQAAGRPIPLSVGIVSGKPAEAPASPASWKDAEWVRKVRESAEAFEIPIQYDEP